MKSIEVNLADGATVRVGPVRFNAWRDIRSALFDLLAQEIVTTVAAVADGPLMVAVRKELTAFEVAKAAGVDPSEADVPALLRAALDELGRGTLQKVGDVVRHVADTLAELADDFVRGCCEELPDDLSALDFMALREKAFEVSDPAELLEREKNFVRGVGNVLTRLIGTSIAPRGSSESKT